MRTINKTTIYIALVFVSLFLFLISYVLSVNFNQERAGNIIQDIAMITVSIVLIDLIWGIAGGDPLSKEISDLKNMHVLYQDGRTTGLTRVLSQVSKVNHDDIDELYSKTENTIDVSGWTLKTFAEDKPLFNKILDRVKNRKLTVRIVIYSPYNPALNYVTGQNKSSLTGLIEDIKYSLAKFQQMKSSLPKDAQKRFIIKELKDGLIYVSVRRSDDTMYVIHYLYGLSVTETPLYVIQGANQPLFEAYMSEFEKLFDQAEEAK